MKQVERRSGKPLEELLRQLFVDEGKTVMAIGLDLQVSHITIIKWLTLAGIYSRQLKTLKDVLDS